MKISAGPSARLLRALVSSVLGAAGLAAVAVGPSVGRAAAATAQVPGTYSVSVSSHTFTIDGRGTPARAGVPASSSRTIHELLYLPSGPAGQLPTVVFAPGWNSQSSDYDVLLRTIASAGYLVVGVDSPGSSSYFPGTPYNTTSGEDIANNTLDLRDALTDVEQGSLGGRVDRAEVAAVGHSDGGSAVATLALDNAYASYRFNAYVVLSGVVPSDQVSGSFGARNNGPVLAMVGTADEFGNYTPQPGGNGTETVYDTAGPSRVFVAIQGAGHESAYIGTGAQANDTRASVVDFLDTAEYHDGGARSRFASEISTDGLGAVQDLAPAWRFGRSTVGMAAGPDGYGYWIATSDGTVRSFGDAPYLGEPSQPVGPVVAMTATADGQGYWAVTGSGVVYGFGDAVFHGDLRGVRLAAPIVGMAADPATGGYWLLGGDGGVFSFDAPFYGSTGGIHLAAPAVGMVATSDGGGYWFVASDGGIFAYGHAPFRGSMGGQPLNRPVVGMTLDRATGGYWLDASDGGIFAFDAPFYGSTGGVRLARPCVSMAAPPGGNGYWLVASDGGVFAFRVPFEGSAT
ncbi:MAG TPA: hypothetical protein VFH58_04440 [Acidimicrobiales bacterium]|nr:hypothetical protein [Acidimicrobiales bacterium]